MYVCSFCPPIIGLLPSCPYSIRDCSPPALARRWTGGRIKGASASTPRCFYEIKPYSGNIPLQGLPGTPGPFESPSTPWAPSLEPVAALLQSRHMPSSKNCPSQHMRRLRALAPSRYLSNLASSCHFVLPTNSPRFFPSSFTLWLAILRDPSHSPILSFSECYCLGTTSSFTFGCNCRTPLMTRLTLLHETRCPNRMVISLIFLDL